MRDLWNKISDIGTHQNLPFSENSRIRISNQMSVITSLLSVLYYLFGLFFIEDQKTPAQLFTYNLLSFGFAVHCFPVLYLNYKGYVTAARALSILFYFVILTLNSMTLVQPFRSEIYFFGCAAFVFIIFREMKVIVPFYLLQMVGYILAAYSIIEHNPQVTSINSGLFIRIFIGFSVLFFVLYFLRNETTSYQSEIEIKNLELSAERDEIQKINFTKDKIFSIISHDLRSPIGSLKSVLELLHKGHLSEEEFKRSTAGLAKQVEQLKNSLDELLTWSRAQLHGITPEPEVIQLKQLVSEVVSVNRLAARNKTLIVTTNISSEATVYCDPNMLRSILTNLITNAIKFTPVGGAISIVSNKRGEFYEICIEDTGLGIPKENLKKILDPLIHFTTRGTNNEKGTGLGLVMCREFVEKNKGKLEVESEDGKGSLFKIILPAKMV